MSGRMFCNYWTDEMSAGVSVRFYCCLPYGHAEEHKLSKELLNAPPPAAPDVTVAGSDKLDDILTLFRDQLIDGQIVKESDGEPWGYRKSEAYQIVAELKSRLLPLLATLPTRSEAQSMPTVVEVLQRKLKSEQQRIGSGRSNQVTDLLNQLIVEVAMKEASVAVKPIVDAEIRNEEATRSLQLGSSAAGRSEAQIRALTFESFAAMNRERCESPTGFNHKLSSWSTSDWFTAILGELGEAANVAKKLNRVRDGIRGNKEAKEALKDKLRQELGDTFVYLDLLSQSLGFFIGDAAMEVFESKSKELSYRKLAGDQ